MLYLTDMKLIIASCVGQLSRARLLGNIHTIYNIYSAYYISSIPYKTFIPTRFLFKNFLVWKLLLTMMIFCYFYRQVYFFLNLDKSKKMLFFFWIEKLIIERKTVFNYVKNEWVNGKLPASSPLTFLCWTKTSVLPICVITFPLGSGSGIRIQKISKNGRSAI